MWRKGFSQRNGAISSRVVIEEVKMLTQKRYEMKRKDNIRIFGKILDFCQNGNGCFDAYGTAITSQPGPQPVASALPFSKIPKRLDPLPVREA